MYTAYWGLKYKPFENNPDPRFLFHTQQHTEALSRLLYVVREHKGAVLLTGECGSGKTLLIRVLWQELQKENIYQPAFVLNPRLSGIEFIQEIVGQLAPEQTVPTNKIDLFHALHKIFYANFNAGKHTVVIIDEAQAINDTEIFEELRLLLNFQLDYTFLLTIILSGQPELKYILIHLPQFMQRVAVRFHLQALSENEVMNYVQHRLQIAGAAGPIFADDCYHEIYILSKGIPRRINTICDLSLLVGFGNGFKAIEKKIISEIGKDLDLSFLYDTEPVQPENKTIPQDKNTLNENKG